MAMFREHVAIGAIVSMVVVVLTYFYALITDPWLLLILFVITVIGSFLPDVDSDSGIPFYMVFGGVTLAATGVVLLYMLSQKPEDWRVLLGVPTLALFFVWFIVGGIVKKCTRHRGIFHSIPAMLVAGTGTMVIARALGIHDELALVFGGGMAIGFATHLILDELHSGIALDGNPFTPKASLGTAIKLFSRSNGVNIATYLVLATLVYRAFLQAPRAEAYYFNDSEIIEVGDGVPKNIYTGQVTEGGYITPPEEPEPDPEEEVVVPPVTPPVTPTPVVPNPETPPSAPPVVPQSDADAIDALITSGAILGGELVTAGSFFQDSILAGFEQSLFGSGGSLFVYGSRVRESLRGVYDLGSVLNEWRAGRTGALSARGYGLIAASTALGDTNMQYIVFSANAFEITYRSRGYLLGIFPISFPVKIGVIPEATSDRVSVRLPWYRFFVREFFTARGLASEIDGVVLAEIKSFTKPPSDLKAVLFEAVSVFLKQKMGTIAETVILGT